MVLEDINGLMEENIVAIGLMIKCMGLVYFNGVMVDAILVSI
jgi:hypothetical protein